jgi:hypothetical protein
MTLRCLALVAALALAGCQEPEHKLVIPPPPLPEYLSHDLKPDTPSGQSATAAAPAATSAESARAAKPAVPPDLAAQIADVEKVVERIQNESGPKAAPLGKNQAPAVEPGGKPVPVTVEVPADAGAAIKRLAPNSVGVTGIEAAGEVPVPPTAPHKPKPADSTADTVIASAAPASGDAQPTAADAASLAALVRQYEALAAKNPADVDVARTLRVLQLLAGEDEKSLAAVPGLPAEQQKVWRGLMWTMINARDRLAGMSQADQAAEILDALDEVRTTVAKQAPLELGEVRFCDRVRGFGSYDVVPAARFQRRQTVYLYSEVRNFVSERGEGGKAGGKNDKAAEGLYRVLLNERVSLENAEGKSVWQDTFPNIEDFCRQARQDFFLTTRLNIPADAAPGKYTLKVTIEDALGHKSVGAKLDLEIVGGP